MCGGVFSTFFWGGGSKKIVKSLDFCNAAKLRPISRKKVSLAGEIIKKLPSFVLLRCLFFLSNAIFEVYFCFYLTLFEQ